MYFPVPGEDITLVLNYILEKVPDLWDEHDKDISNLDGNEWNSEYFSLIKKDLRRNFSKDRFEHYIEIGNFIKQRNVDLIRSKNSQLNVSSNKSIIKSAQEISNQIIRELIQFFEKF